MPIILFSLIMTRRHDYVRDLICSRKIVSLSPFLLGRYKLSQRSRNVTRKQPCSGFSLVFRLHGKEMKRSNALVRSMIIKRVQPPFPVENDLKLFDTEHSDGIGFILSGTAAGLPRSSYMSFFFSLYLQRYLILQIIT